MKNKFLFNVMLVCCMLVSCVVLYTVSGLLAVKPVAKSAVISADTTVVPTQTAAPTQTPVKTPMPTPTPRFDATKPAVALSFDDGPCDEYTDRILDTLEKYDVTATFFVIGQNAQARPQILQRQVAAGCEIGNHTYTHELRFTTSDLDEVISELDKTKQVVYEATGKEIKLVRPPWGAYNDEVKSRIDAPLILWTVDTRDWESKDPNAVLDVVRNEVHDGYIILMHDRLPSTCEAVELVVPWLIENGYQVMSVSELFELKGIQLQSHASYDRVSVSGN